MPFHYWLTVIIMLLVVGAGSIIAAIIGWKTYLECKDIPDEEYGESYTGVSK